MIKPQWLELPVSRTIFYGPKDVRAIEVRLYMYNILNCVKGNQLRTVFRKICQWVIALLIGQIKW